MVFLAAPSPSDDESRCGECVLGRHHASPASSALAVHAMRCPVSILRAAAADVQHRSYPTDRSFAYLRAMTNPAPASRARREDHGGEGQDGRGCSEVLTWGCLHAWCDAWRLHARRRRFATGNPCGAAGRKGRSGFGPDLRSLLRTSFLAGHWHWPCCRRILEVSILISDTCQ